MQILEYTEKHSKEWDKFAATAPMATFLHTRKFLSYHGERFRDKSLLVYDKNKLLALFPAAESLKDNKTVISHPGITYGGLLHQGMISGNTSLEILSLITNHYKNNGYTNLQYKAVPSFYHQIPCEEDLWALFKLDAKLYRLDLARLVNLQHKLIWGDERQEGIRKCKKADVIIKRGKKHAAAFWEVLKGNLQDKHDAIPTHSLEEMQLLTKLFPDEIEFFVAVLHGEIIAGSVLFITPTAVHVQYSGSSKKGYELSAQEMVYYKAIEYSKKISKHYFSFGISTEQEGKVLNEPLDRFKKKFSGGGVGYGFYEMNL